MNSIVRTLALKELYLYRWLMAGTSVATALSALACAFGRTAFNIGSLAWITAVIVCSVMLSLHGVLNERKEQSLQFVLSLPISTAQYLLAKILGLLMCFLVPWSVASASAIALVLLSPGIKDGLLPYVVLLCGFMLANFSVLLGGALQARSEGLVTAMVILTNMAVSVFLFTVGGLPGIGEHMSGPVAVWNRTVSVVLLLELLVVAVAITLPLATASRRRDFL